MQCEAVKVAAAEAQTEAMELDEQMRPYCQPLQMKRAEVADTQRRIEALANQRAEVLNAWDGLHMTEPLVQIGLRGIGDKLHTAQMGLEAERLQRHELRTAIRELTENLMILDRHLDALE